MEVWTSRKHYASGQSGWVEAQKQLHITVLTKQLHRDQTVTRKLNVKTHCHYHYQLGQQHLLAQHTLTSAVNRSLHRTTAVTV